MPDSVSTIQGDKMATMTRQHFKLLAEALKNSKPEDPIFQLTWANDVEAIANACATTNSLFDRAKFLAACDIGDM